MNVIKVEVNIDIDSNEQVKAFNDFISSLKKCSGEKPTVTAAVKDIAVKDANVVPTHVSEHKAIQTNTVKLDDIRKLISEKVENNRAAIKAKLVELGSETATDLDVVKYGQMYEFLKSL